ncbi:glycosyltransferase [Arthrobacter sp. MI7-26]|uniref:glycosyltransferase n=1 Tax=Arthrobacter sp. MI7-26 TaxID=2993653 RepID=UPI0022491A93|nr:glycosyltransferase [Arthrobacter sp. MI7-26]MCX2750282.1 glycosyltransferase [Arthrobacter sp. MI7-26]
MTFPAGAVIIPAHNEVSVIGRTLTALKPVLAAGSVEVIVVCNGCKDDTAKIASNFAGVTVLDLLEASKAAALNEGDRVATLWPRLYLDADVEISPKAVGKVFRALSDGKTLAARPSFRYDTDGASVLVRAYYAARSRLPATKTALWGAGAYAMSETGHRRIGAFPRLTGDDLYVDRMFAANEKTVLNTEPTIVRTPRTVASLLAVLRRVYGGNEQQDPDSRSSARTLNELRQSVKGPKSVLDALVYVTFALWARRQWSSSETARLRWERDESSR